MVTGTRIITRNNNELKSLRNEVALLRSIVIGILGEDREGKYRPDFIKAILKAAKERPKFEFKGTADLIKQLKRA